jgi:hypothetical protein
MLQAPGTFLWPGGERVRALRARRGMTRKAWRRPAEVSERHLANLEYGVGNAIDPGAAAGGAGPAVLAGRADRRRHHLQLRVAAAARAARAAATRRTLRRVRADGR